MAIDPRLYTKYSGRSGDPRDRLGEVLARDVQVKQNRDEMPKGVSGGLRSGLFFGFWSNLFFFWSAERRRSREK